MKFTVEKIERVSSLEEIVHLSNEDADIVVKVKNPDRHGQVRVGLIAEGSSVANVLASVLTGEKAKANKNTRKAKVTGEKAKANKNTQKAKGNKVKETGEAKDEAAEQELKAE